MAYDKNEKTNRYTFRWSLAYFVRDLAQLKKDYFFL